jgi:hypothetical protein
MHQQGRAQGADLAEIFLRVATVISNNGVDVKSAFLRLSRHATIPGEAAASE